MSAPADTRLLGGVPIAVIADRLVGKLHDHVTGVMPITAAEPAKIQIRGVPSPFYLTYGEPPAGHMRPGEEVLHSMPFTNRRYFLTVPHSARGDELVGEVDQLFRNQLGPGGGFTEHIRGYQRWLHALLAGADRAIARNDARDGFGAGAGSAGMGEGGAAAGVGPVAGAGPVGGGGPAAGMGAGGPAAGGGAGASPDHSPPPPRAAAGGGSRALSKSYWPGRYTDTKVRAMFPVLPRDARDRLALVLAREDEAEYLSRRAGTRPVFMSLGAMLREAGVQGSSDDEEGPAGATPPTGPGKRVPVEKTDEHGSGKRVPVEKTDEHGSYSPTPPDHDPARD